MQEQISFFDEAEKEIQRIQRKRTATDDNGEGYWCVYAWVTGPGVKLPFTDYVDTVYASSREAAISKCVKEYKVPRYMRTTHRGLICVNYSAERSQSVALEV